MLPPEVEGISENPEIEPVLNRPPIVVVGQYSEALKLTGKEISWTPDTNKTSVSDDRLEKPEDLFLTWEFIPSEGQSLNDVKFGKYQTIEGQDEDEFVENSHEKQVTAWFMKKGKYRLRLTASDGLLSASDETVLVVNQKPTSTINLVSGPESKATNQNELNWEVTLQCEVKLVWESQKCFAI
jgi:hypothetical protein